MATYSVTKAAGGATVLTNPGNISASDDVYATITLSPLNKPAFVVYNFGFSIPSGATINGISVSIEGHASIGSDISIYSAILGIYSGNTFSPRGSTEKNSTLWTTTDSSYVMGSSSDLWGASWTVNDINSSGFGCQITLFNSDNSNNVTVYIDCITITITYTATGTTWQLTASIPMMTILTPQVSIIKRIISSIVGSTSFSGVVKRFAGLKASISGASILSSVISIYKSLISAINGATQISPFLAIQKRLTAVVQSSTSFISDLIIRGKQFLNAIVSAGTTFVSNLTAHHTLSSVLSCKTQISPFISIQKALQGSVAGRTLFTGTINRVKWLVSNITTQTILTAQLIVPKLLSALISGGTSFAGQIRRLRSLASQVIGHTTIQAQLIIIQLLQAVISSTTHMSALLKRNIKMFASFVGSTIFVAVPTFWSRVKKLTATWRQKSEEVGTWKRIK